MTEEILENNHEEKKRAFRFEWLLPVFFRPRRTLEQIALQTYHVWLLPLLILTLFAIVQIAAEGPLRQQNLQNTTSMPADMQYMSEAQIAQLQEAMAAQQGFTAVYVFPAVGAVIGVWLSWILLGSLLHLALTLAGSRSTNLAALNLAGWALLPLALRYLVRIIYILSAQKMISGPGLSGFVATDASGFLSYLASFLGQIDLYMIWSLILLLVGVTIISGLNRAKAWLVTIVAFLLVLALLALPDFLLKQFSNLTPSSSSAINKG